MTDSAMRHFLGYQFGYELLMLNGVITFFGLWVTGNLKPQIGH